MPPFLASVLLMPEPLAYLNGQLLSANELTVPVYDAGFVQGLTVAEQMRTFGGRIFRLERHLQRLARALEMIGVVSPFSLVELAQQAQHLVAHNHRLLESGNDLGLSLFVTPGPYSAFTPPEAQGPLVALHTYPVPFRSFAAKYTTGEALVITPVQQVPVECWPAELKCRSRMHYYLADKAARAQEPGARALLCDAQGYITEASTANVLVYFVGAGLVSPPREKILPGITLETLVELAGKLGITFQYQELKPHDMARASEAFLCSTSPALLPVLRLNGKPLGQGVPGAVFSQLISAWNELVGIDIVAQARMFA